AKLKSNFGRSRYRRRPESAGKRAAVNRDRLSRLRCFGFTMLTLCCLTLGPAASKAQRIPGQRPMGRPAALLGTVRDQNNLPVPGITVTAVNRRTNQTFRATSNGEGIFRLRDLPPGDYEVSGMGAGYGANPPLAVTLRGAQVQQLAIRLEAAAAMPMTSPGPGGVPGRPSMLSQPDLGESSPYPGLRMPQPEVPPPVYATAEAIPPDSATFTRQSYRWTVEMPDWQRYNKDGEFPFTKARWYDP